ncbi:hypothetical protein ACFQI3_05020 [Hansschlegelia quercus]|uniref:Uncharacterized protein n=1 Tax=Hansschlegelia quercus TaxID=2528245 RepID=A0A4Q9GSP9_9HYPH|nr:hypothetical protein [Hansschlegelia quercus]TBN55230.1 hypothetical protein EYR15_03615 [Hansschlegelia quercus]
MMIRHPEQDAWAFDADAHLKSMTSLDWADSVQGSTEKGDMPTAEPRTEPKAAAPQEIEPRFSTRAPRLIASAPAAADVEERRRPSAVTLVVLCAAFAALGFAGVRMFGGPGEGSPANAPATADGAADAQRGDRLTALNIEIESRQKVLADLQRKIDDRSVALEAPDDAASGRASKEELGAPESRSAPRRPAQVARPQEEVSPRDTVAEDLPSDELPSRTGSIAAPPPSAPARGAAPAPRASAEAPSTGRVRVFIHVPIGAAGTLARARAIAAELARDGVAVADIRSVPHAVRRDAVRYFYDADRAALGTVERAVRDASPPGGPPPAAQDFRGYAAPPRPGTLEIWLS